MKRNKDGGYRLPEIIDPERICVQLYVPNDMNHLLAFWAQLEGLGSAMNWANDEAHTALDVAAVWRDVYMNARENWLEGGCMDPECCDELSANQVKTNLLLDKLISLFEDGFKIVPIGGLSSPPDVGAGACAPDFFDHNTGDSGATLIQRQKALCITAERYVKEILLKATIDMLAPDIIAEWIESSITQSIPLPLQKIEVVYADAFSGIAALVSAATGGADLKVIACKMVTQLTGDKNNTFGNFKESVVLSDFDDFPLLLSLAALVRGSNSLKLNFGLFNDAMILAFEEDLEDYECPCDVTPPSTCDEDLVIVDNLRPSTVITPMGDNIFRIQNSEIQVDSLYYADIDTDTPGQSIDILVPTDMGTYPVQPTANYQIYEIDDTTLRSSGTGGFAPVEACGRVTFSSGTPVDTYYKVICHVDTP